VIFDSDVLIWVLRGNRRAARMVDADGAPCLSIVSYMELLHGARNRAEARTIRDALEQHDFQLLGLSENIGHRAAMYMEQYGLATALDVADALIAATAAENALPLATGNQRHFGVIPDIEIVPFRPR